MRVVLGIVGALLAIVAFIVAFYATALRTKQPKMLGVIRRINRGFFNPRQMQTAGTPGAYASVVQHVGRTSGLPYETPIVVRELGDRFVVVLPYARQADWVRNVEAAGGATIVCEGTTWTVDDPQFVGLDDVTGAMTASEARQNRWAGAVDVMTLRRAQQEPAS